MKNFTLYTAGLFSLVFLTQCNTRESAVTTQLAVPVSVLTVKPTTIREYVNATGTAMADKEVSLNSEMTGDYQVAINPATDAPYKLGDIVNKDDVVITLENDEYINGIKIESLKLNLEISKMEFDKQKSLYEKGGVTLRELRNSEVSYINAKYAYENGNINFAKTDVIAPFKGAIAEMPIFTDGTRIPSNTVLVKLVNYNQLYIEINLPEKYYSKIRPGILANVSSYSATNDTLIGSVSQISPYIDPTARTFKCIVNVENNAKAILPGMFVKVDLEVNSVENAIVVPKEIIKGKGGYRYLFAINEGQAFEKAVRTGIETNDQIEIISGLNSGDRIVIKGYETLRSKSTVKILNEEVTKVEEQPKDSKEEKKEEKKERKSQIRG